VLPTLQTSADSIRGFKSEILQFLWIFPFLSNSSTKIRLWAFY